MTARERMVWSESMSTHAAPWQRPIETPAPRDHVVQMYRDPILLADVVARYCRQGLVTGEAVLVIATPEHRAAFAGRLQELGTDVPTCRVRGQYVDLDAEDCLALFMVDGAPDRARFFAAIQARLQGIRRSGFDRLRLYGEMVDVLRPTAFAAAMQIEELWHELLATESFPLLCGYQVDPLDRDEGRKVVPAIARRHSHVVPGDDPARFEASVELAFVEVFGADEDSALLRRLCESATSRASIMPPAQAMLLNLDDLMPYLGDAVRAAAARYYRAA